METSQHLIVLSRSGTDRASMKEKLKRMAKIVLGKEPVAGRSVSVYPDDVFITSYPRSGNTWMRFLVANLFWQDGSTSFLNINERVPDIYKFSDSHLSPLPRPRFLKSHEYFDPRYPKVVYIVRDIRSVLVSLYYNLLRRGKISPRLSYYEFAKMLLDGNLNRYGAWREHVLSWIRMRGDDHERFCLVRYEDLKTEGISTLRIVASFLGFECSDGELELALERSSFNRMQRLEKEADGRWKGSKVKRRGIPLVRFGSTNEWKQELGQRTLSLIYRECDQLLLELGYEL